MSDNQQEHGFVSQTVAPDTPKAIQGVRQKLSQISSPSEEIQSPVSRNKMKQLDSESLDSENQRNLDSFMSEVSFHQVVISLSCRFSFNMHEQMNDRMRALELKLEEVREITTKAHKVAVEADKAITKDQDSGCESRIACVGSTSLMGQNY